MAVILVLALVAFMGGLHLEKKRTELLNKLQIAEEDYVKEIRALANEHKRLISNIPNVEKKVTDPITIETAMDKISTQIAKKEKVGQKNYVKIISAIHDELTETERFMFWR